MSDIRKRTWKSGKTSYQVRYADNSSKSGYSYKNFKTRKEALAFSEDAARRDARSGGRRSDIQTVQSAAKLWLDICEKEGLNGRDPVTGYTLENYEYRVGYINKYPWGKSLHELTPPDIVEFRSWLLRSGASRDLARKVLASLQSILKEMSIRDVIARNVATGISVRDESRYDEPVLIPSKDHIRALLKAADTLSNSKNETIAKAWQRYRPMLYLAIDSGMRPQEYLAASKSALRPTGIQVERAVEGGGGKISITKTSAGRRFIDLSPNTLDMVRHYAEKHARVNDHDLIFPDETGKWQDRRNWQRSGFDIACEEAGLVEPVEQDGKPKLDKKGKAVTRALYRPYDLRHFFASRLIERKVNLKKIQTLMGHANIETTLNVYGHLLDDDLPTFGSAQGMLSDLYESKSH